MRKTTVGSLFMHRNGCPISAILRRKTACIIAGRAAVFPVGEAAESERRRGYRRRLVLSHLPDELLAERAAAGRLDEFEELVRRYRTRVYRVCYRLAGNAEDAEDWAQECLVRVYQQLAHFDPAVPFGAWLTRVTWNAALNLVKSRQRRQNRLTLGLQDDAPGAASGCDPSRGVLAREDLRRVQAALDHLPDILREATVLRILEELSFSELAATLGVPLQTAAARVRRGLEQVRRQLTREELVEETKVDR